MAAYNASLRARVPKGADRGFATYSCCGDARGSKRGYDRHYHAGEVACPDCLVGAAANQTAALKQPHRAEAHRAQAKRYAKTDAGRLSAKRRSAERRAKKMNAICEEHPPPVPVPFDAVCVCCGKRGTRDNPTHQDHKWPLHLGGKHCAENTQPLCGGVGGCNHHKGAGTDCRLHDKRLVP